MTTLERLPNELLFMTFDYLWYNEIINAFYQLNNHFDSLLLSYSCYSLDISDPIVQFGQLLPNTSAIRSLILLSNQNKVSQYDRFVSQYPWDLFYTNLRYLSLNQLNCDQIVALQPSLLSFEQLESLSIGEMVEGYKWVSSGIRDKVCNTILFEIPTLKYFAWNCTASLFHVFLNEQKSSSINRSTIEFYRFDSLTHNQLEWLDVHTLNLRSIDFSLSFYCWLDKIHNGIFKNLIYLKLNKISSKGDLEKVFGSSMYLAQLKLLQVQGEVNSNIQPIDGYQWQSLIENYFPQLKILKFFFKTKHWYNSLNVDVLIQSFQTDFWIEQKKWFITLDYHVLSDKTYLYTIPSINTELGYSRGWKQISTKQPIDTTNTRQLTLFSTQFEPISAYSRFTNVEILILNIVPSDTTVSQLTALVNMSFLRYIDFQFDINEQLFFNLLKHINQTILIVIQGNNLADILTRVKITEDDMIHLKQISCLHLKHAITNRSITKFLRNLCRYFPRVRELVFFQSLSISNVIDLFTNLEDLSSLQASNCDDLIALGETKFRQLLIKKQKKRPRKNIICRIDARNFQVFRSNSELVQKNKNCTLI